MDPRDLTPDQVAELRKEIAEFRMAIYDRLPVNLRMLVASTNIFPEVCEEALAQCNGRKEMAERVVRRIIIDWALRENKEWMIAEIDKAFRG